MQKFSNNGQHLEAAIRKAMGQSPSLAIPMLVDQHGNPISVIASVISIDRKVLAAIEEVCRRVVREELATALEETSDEPSIS